MPNYRRYREPGGCYFFTVNLYDRRQSFLTEKFELLKNSVCWVKNKYPFHIDAWVVLPDHLHCIWTLQEGDSNYTGRWREIKKRFSRLIPNTEYRTDIQMRRHERGIWQRRYWEHFIRDDHDYATHIDYIHYNPVKHGLVERACDWQFSSFYEFVRKGVYPRDWATNNDIDRATGERL